MPIATRLAALLASRRLPWMVGALAALIVAPAIGSGLVVDDYVLRAAEIAPSPSGGGPTPFDLFHFMVPSDYPRLLNAGVLPWWASPELKLAFFRPLASASHWLDFHLFPGSPAAMHLVSIAWLAATVVVAALLYRRLLDRGWVAGLAALLFALDPGHALSAGWVSARNAVMAAFFGIAAVYAHDRWRRDGERWAGVLAPLLCAASLLSAEAGVATLGVLGAHAIAFEGTLRARVRALGPHAAVAMAWATLYRARGSGAAHSAMYVDPMGSPADFLRSAALGIPINLGSRLGGLPASTAIFLADRALPVAAAVGVVFVIFAAIALAPLVKQEPPVRFFALAGLFSVVPIAATLPNDRNLFLVGFAAFGLVALVVRRAAERRSLPLRAYAGWLLFHLGLAAIPTGLANARGMDLFVRFSRDPLSRVLLDDASRRQTAIFVNPPVQFFMSQFAASRVGTGEPVPERLRSLWPGIYPARATRVRDDQLQVRVKGGILPRPGTWPAASRKAPLLKAEYVGQHLGSFVRGARDPMHAGDVIDLPGLRASVLEVAEGGSPSVVTFTFDRSLDDPSLRWLVWQDGGYAPFTPPRVGASVDLAPVSMKP